MAVTPIVTLVLVAACSDGAGPADAGPAGPGTPTTTAPLAVEPGRLVVEVELLEVDTAPLVADLRVRADRPVVPVVTVEGPGGTFAVPAPDADTEHRIPVAGMRAGAEHLITVELVEETGTPVPAPHQAVFVTPAVPDDLPPL
jgi:hypothetical protein